MSSYDYGIISRTEATELKEMIFKRVRERAEILAEEGKSQYTDSIQREVMDIARESLRESKNPFAPVNLTQNKKNTPKTEKVIYEDIGHEKNEQKPDIRETKAKIERDYQAIREYIKKDEVADAMDKTSTSLRNRKSFIGALEFLNAKASQSLINKKAKGFDAIA